MTVVEETTVGVFMKKINLSAEAQTRISKFIFVIPMIIVLGALGMFFFYSLYLILLHMMYGPRKMLEQFTVERDDIEAQRAETLEERVKKFQAKRSLKEAKNHIRCPERVLNKDGEKSDEYYDDSVNTGNSSKDEKVIEDDSSSQSDVKTVVEDVDNPYPSSFINEYCGEMVLPFTQRFPSQQKAESAFKTWWCFQKENRWKWLTKEGLKDYTARVKKFLSPRI